MDTATNEPPRADLDASSGAVLVEFGTAWCGHCKAAQPLIAEALSAHPNVRHIKVEDGKGRVLGRSFKVTLWPTLVLMVGRREVARFVRPLALAPVAEALGLIDSPAP